MTDRITVACGAIMSTRFNEMKYGHSIEELKIYMLRFINADLHPSI